MVCGLTVGRKKYADFDALNQEVEAKALALKDKFVTIIDTDTDAFNAVSAVFTMPKDTDEEKAARKVAMLAALKGCTISPFVVSSWSGGTTTQVGIAPAGAVYASRDFMWRVSSATVDLEVSDFTALPD